MPEMKLTLTRLEWALMMQESSGRQLASRLDPNWRARLAARGVEGEELDFQCRAWGLWQIAGHALRELRYKGSGARFCADAALQLSYMRRKWRRDTDRRDPEWWNIEHWNQDPWQKRRRSPSTYYRGVSGWLRSSAARGRDLELHFPEAA
jgi:hypothetical protein